MCASAIDVANFYITLFRDSEDPMTKVRIQKFMYYAQAQTLVRLGHPLFDEDFEAWHYGPVIPSVSSCFRHTEDMNPIGETYGNYDVHIFSSEELEILMDVAKYCGKYSTGELSERTHVVGGPWASVHTEDGKAAIIPKSSIKNYYSEHERISSTLSEAIGKLETEGYVDEKGRFVHPGNWE